MKFVTLRGEHIHRWGEYMSRYKRRVLVMTKSTQTLMQPTQTLTQSGLLALLLQRQRHRIQELARRRAQGKRLRAAFWTTLNWSRGMSTLPKLVEVPRHT
jgi:hypothetical protein